MPLPLPEIEAALKYAYKDTDGHEISERARHSLSYDFAGHAYGEADTDRFYSILARAVPKPHETFFDLGSGLGKKVIIASLGFTVSHATGIEQIPELLTAGVTACDTLKTYFGDPQVLRNVTLTQGDYYQADFAGGDIVFISIIGSILEGQLSGYIGEQFARLKKGARIITTDLPITHKPDIKWVESIPDQPAGGSNSLYLHVRV